MADSYHYFDDAGVQQGPVTVLAFERLWSGGAVRGETDVWGDGMADWAPANTVPALLSALSQPFWTWRLGGLHEEALLAVRMGGSGGGGDDGGGAGGVPGAAVGGGGGGGGFGGGGLGADLEEALAPELAALLANVNVEETAAFTAHGANAPAAEGPRVRDEGVPKRNVLIYEWKGAGKASLLSSLPQSLMTAPPVSSLVAGFRFESLLTDSSSILTGVAAVGGGAGGGVGGGGGFGAEPAGRSVDGESVAGGGGDVESGAMAAARAGDAGEG